MNRMWQKKLGCAAIAPLLAFAVSGCVARPAPRPDPRTVRPDSSINADLSAAVTNTAGATPGAGSVSGLVIDNMALMAIQLNATLPGGTEGGSIIGTTNDPDYPGTSPGGGPITLQGPGGSGGVTPGMPGGGLHPGGAAPGGTPNYTQAVPNGYGGLATQGGSTTSPAPNPGTLGASPFDVMTRIANQIKSRHKTITEVKFATNPSDAIRVADIARRIRAGEPGANFRDELSQIAQRSVPAGVYEFSPMDPPQGQQPMKVRPK